MKTNIVLLTLLLISCFYSCKHEHDEDVQHPVITLTSPSDQQLFHPGDTLFIKGNVTDNHDLHELIILLTRNEDGDTLLNFMPIIHGLKEYTIDTFHIVNETGHVHYTLSVTAYDHDNNSSNRTLGLHVDH